VLSANLEVAFTEGLGIIVTEFELLELLRGANDRVDSNFQFWISASFAVLMAFYFAAGKIRGFIKWTVLILYALSSMLFVFRIQATGRMATNIRGSLEAMNSEYLTVGAVAAARFIGTPLMLITFLGTQATAYFCIRSEKILSK
jgi:phosphatidylserine synthase